MLRSDVAFPSGPSVPKRPPKDGSEDESSESEDDQPPCQEFEVQATDRKVLGHFKIDAPYDKETQKNVVYWDELVEKYDEALYIKGKDDKHVHFLKDKVSNEPFYPWRVAHRGETLNLILNQSSADEKTQGPRIVPLSKGTRIEPERQPSFVARWLQQVQEVLHGSRGIWVAPLIPAAQPGMTAGRSQSSHTDRSDLGPGQEGKHARGPSPPPSYSSTYSNQKFATQGGQGRQQGGASSMPGSGGEVEITSDQRYERIVSATPLPDLINGNGNTEALTRHSNQPMSMMATIPMPQAQTAVSPSHQKSLSTGANEYRPYPFSDHKGDMIRSEPAYQVFSALVQRALVEKMGESSNPGNPTPDGQRVPEPRQRFETPPPTVYTCKSHEQLDSLLQRDTFSSFGDQPMCPLPASPASPTIPPRYSEIPQRKWIPYDYIIIPSLMPTHTGQSPVNIVALCQSEFRPEQALVSSHIPASTAYVIDDPATFLSQYGTSLSAASPVLLHVLYTASQYNRSPYKSLETWNGLWKGRLLTENLRLHHHMTVERPFIPICLNKPEEIMGMRDVLKNAQKPSLDDGLTSGLQVVHQWGKEIYWRCDACSEIASQHQDQADRHQVTLEEYGQLCQRKKELLVRVSNLDAVHHLLEALDTSRSTSKIHLEIDTTFFNSHAMGEQRQRVAEIFGRLTRAMLIQSPLLDLKITAEPSPRYDEIFQLMNPVFSSSSLRELTLINMPPMLQQPNLVMDCPDLRLLCLDNVHVENEAAAKNLVNLILRVSRLEVLHMSRMRLTKDAFSVVMSDTHVNALSQRFRNLRELSLVANGLLTCDQLLDFVAMALALGIDNKQSSGSIGSNVACKLKKLDLSENSKMGAGGWESFFRRFETRKKTLIEIGCTNSGADEKIQAKLVDFILVE